VARAPEVRVRTIAIRLWPLGREEQDVVSRRADSMLEADQHVLKERVADVGVLEAREQDDPDQLRAPFHKRAGGGARCVVERTSCGENPLSRCGTHVAVPVEDPGDGRDGDATELRYLVDGARFDLRKRFRCRTLTPRQSEVKVISKWLI
jgi:hypothetical protein